MIVVGGDKTLEAAEFELNKAKKISSKATIYQREKSYRTVITEITKSDEEVQLLAEAKTIFKDAYVRTESEWCNQIIESDKYFICETK